MNFHWPQSTKFLLVILASALAIDGVLTTLVINQQHHQSPVTGQASLTTPAARVPAPASPAPPPASAPQVATPLTPPQVASPPRVTSIRQPVPAPHKLVKPKPLPHRRVDPVPVGLPFGIDLRRQGPIVIKLPIPITVHFDE